jgi:hypothetical protein
MGKFMGKQTTGGEKTMRGFSAESVVCHLKKENTFLRQQLQEMTVLCTKLASTTTNASCNPLMDPELLEHRTPTAVLNLDTPSLHLHTLSLKDETFILPRRTSKKHTPAKNSWDPISHPISLRNSYSSLSVENVHVPDDYPDDCMRNVNVKKRATSRAAVKDTRENRSIVTEKYLDNFVPFVPGRKSYASALNGRDVLVIGDSMLQRIRKKEFSDCMHSNQAIFKGFPGANVQKINYYLLPELQENNFKKVIVHCGTNDLYYRSAEDIVNSMREFYYSCMSHGVEKVIFSDIIVRKGRRYIEEKRLLVNSLLKDICDRDWVVNACLIENTNIYQID